MSLEGLRAWIGEVERKLDKRTRVFLALTVIAIGIAGASVYLAIDARNSSVSESDVQELQQQLEAQIDEAAMGTPGAAAEPVEPAEPEAEPETGSAPEPKPKSGSKQGSDTGGVGIGASSGAADGNPSGNTGNARIQELLEQAQEQNAEAEDGTSGK